jgi:hypothetical protein
MSAFGGKADLAPASVVAGDRRCITLYVRRVKKKGEPNTPPHLQLLRRDGRHGIGTSSGMYLQEALDFR